MTASSNSTIVFLSLRRIKAAAIISCFLFLGAQTAFAESSSVTKWNGSNVVAQKRVETHAPGIYHYESQYEMTKDGKGNYHSTYESQSTEWFCCLDWFSSEDTPSIKAGKS